MINVYIRNSGKFHEIEAKGHAQYAPLGSDIVCSAFSVLIYTLNTWLEQNKDKAVEYKNKIETGEICIAFKEISPEAETVFDTICVGVSLLSENYPENIVVNGY